MTFDFLSNLTYWSYFRVETEYYLFLFARNQVFEVFITMYLSRKIFIKKNIKTRKRRLRSLRGFCLYVIELMQAKEDVKIINTNLDPSFWEEIQGILRQKTKSKLNKFLFRNKIQDFKVN